MPVAKDNREDMVKTKTTNTFIQTYQTYLDKSTPFTAYRWAGTGVLFLLFALRIIFAQGWYIGQQSREQGLHMRPKC